MEIKLPVPIKSGDTIYTHAEITRPRSKILAQTTKTIRSSSEWHAMLDFIAGCVLRFFNEDGSEVDDKVAIKALVRKMPAVQTANYVVSQILILMDPVKYMEDYEPEFTIDLSEPVVIVNAKTREELFKVETITMRHPTLGDCINAFQKLGANDEVKLQWQIYVESLTAYNGEPIDTKTKNTYGMFIFNELKDPIADYKAISNNYKKHGLDTSVKRHCKNRACGKVWRTNLNTSNFFVSALQSSQVAM